MGLLKEIRNLNYVAEQRFEKEKQRLFELQFEKDVTTLLETNISEKLDCENENEVYIQKEQLINSTIEDLRIVTKESVDQNGNDTLVPKYVIPEENEYEVYMLINNIFSRTAKRVIKEKKEVTNAWLNKLTEEFTCILDRLYLNLRNKGYLKEDVIKLVKSDDSLDFFIKEYGKDHDTNLIKKAFTKSTLEVLKKYNCDKDTTKEIAKAKWKKVPLVDRLLAYNIIINKLAKRWVRFHKYNFK